MNVELTCLLETELNILENGEACCEVCIFNCVNIPAIFSKDKKNILYHLLLKFSTPSKSLDFQRLTPFWWKIIRGAEKQKKKKKKKKEKKKQANINISISYLVLLMLLDSIELI